MYTIIIYLREVLRVKVYREIIVWFCSPIRTLTHQNVNANK